jgi:AAA15 family ATPase/GTPase
MPFPHHEELHIENITVFEKVDFVFSPGINVFVGANGTGKTHVMKFLYTIQSCKHHTSISTDIMNMFQIPHEGDIIRNNGIGEFQSKYDQMENSWHVYGAFELEKSNKILDKYKNIGNISVFIPSIDMIGHTQRFMSTYDQYKIDFDKTHRDIVGLLLSPERRTLSERSSELLASLEKMMGGTVAEADERFYLITEQRDYYMPLVADGFKKIATLYQLIKNGWLEPGSTLFWDEPETHLSPILMDELIGVLLKLAQSGVQIFLATHNYVILKELDLQATPEDKVRYFGFEMTANGTQVHATDDYAMLKPNPITEQLDFIYDRELDRAIGKN